MNYYGPTQFKPGMLIRITTYTTWSRFADETSLLDDNVGLVINMVKHGIAEDEIEFLAGDKTHRILQSNCSCYEVLGR